MLGAGPRGGAVAAAPADGPLRAVVAARGDNIGAGSGLQLVSIYPNGTLLANGSAADGGGFRLAGAAAVDALVGGSGGGSGGDDGGPARALVASSGGGGSIQLVGIHPNGTISPIDSAANGDRGFDRLAGAFAVSAFRMGAGDGLDYAVVSSTTGNGIQLVRIHPNGTLEAAGSAANGTGGFDELDRASDAAVFEMGGWTYALVASYGGNGIQLVRINPDGSLAAEGSAADGVGRFNALWRPEAVDVLDAGGRTYALVTAQQDHAVQLVRLSPASVTGVSSHLQGGSHPAGTAINITVAFDETVMLSDPLRPPSLLIALDGGINRTAEYLSGSGTAGLVFNYTARPGDASSSLEYAHAGALVSRGAVTDMQGNAVDMGLPTPGEQGSLGRTSSVGIDTAPPSVESVSSPKRERRVRDRLLHQRHGAL